MVTLGRRSNSLRIVTIFNINVKNPEDYNRTFGSSEQFHENYNDFQHKCPKSLRIIIGPLGRRSNSQRIVTIFNMNVKNPKGL